MKREMLILLCLAGVILSACSSKSETESKSAPPSTIAGLPAAVAAPAPAKPALSKADASVPLTQYQKLSPEQLVYLYHALSGLPIDYAKIAEQVSVEYRTTSDSFKKKEILDALKPRIDAALADSAKGSRYVYLDFPRGQVSLGHYDLATKSFPISGLPVNEGEYLSLQTSPYRIMISNGNDFNMVSVADDAKARQIESQVSAGTKDGAMIYTNVFPTNARLYLYAQSSESNNFAVNFQLAKLTLNTLDGHPFIEK